MRFLIINGPNINLLGIREPSVYGKEDYNALLKEIDVCCRNLKIQYTHFQSNHEGEIVDKIGSALYEFDGIIINPAAYTHTSVAILDALKAVNIPAIEVHLTDITKREEFRKISYPSLYCEKTFMGKGIKSYTEAINYLYNLVSGKK